MGALVEIPGPQQQEGVSIRWESHSGPAGWSSPTIYLARWRPARIEKLGSASLVCTTHNPYERIEPSDTCLRLFAVIGPAMGTVSQRYLSLFPSPCPGVLTCLFEDQAAKPSSISTVLPTRISIPVSQYSKWHARRATVQPHLVHRLSDVSNSSDPNQRIRVDALQAFGNRLQASGIGNGTVEAPSDNAITRTNEACAETPS